MSGGWRPSDEGWEEQKSPTFATAFRFYRTYNALRLHYTVGAGYDYTRYGGSVKSSESSFRKSRGFMSFVAASRAVPEQEHVQFLNWSVFAAGDRSKVPNVAWVGSLRGMVRDYEKYKDEVLGDPEWFARELKRWYPDRDVDRFKSSFRGHHPEALRDFMVHRDYLPRFLHILDDLVGVYDIMTKSHDSNDLYWPAIYSLVQGSKFERIPRAQSARALKHHFKKG